MGRTMLDRRTTFWLLLLPPLIWLLAFFLFPILIMGAFSFREDSHGLLFSAWDLGFKQYTSLLNTPSYGRLLGLSSLVALTVSSSGGNISGGIRRKQRVSISRVLR